MVSLRSQWGIKVKVSGETRYMDKDLGSPWKANVKLTVLLSEAF